MFRCVLLTAFELLRWEDDSLLPEDFRQNSQNESFVTMLFNDEVHTYEQVGSIGSHSVVVNQSPTQRCNACCR